MASGNPMVLLLDSDLGKGKPPIESGAGKSSFSLNTTPHLGHFGTSLFSVLK